MSYILKGLVMVYRVVGSITVNQGSTGYLVVSYQGYARLMAPL